jgi:hypothetical protein
VRDASKKIISISACKASEWWWWSARRLAGNAIMRDGRAGCSGCVLRQDRLGWVGLARSDGASVRGEVVAGTEKRSTAGRPGELS